MTELLVVRHGQAGASAEAYDQLSDLGKEQALRLGRWLLAHGRRFDNLYVGRMRRQRETIEGVRAVYEAAGQALPVPQVLPGLDEYGFVEVARAFAARYPEHEEVKAVTSTSLARSSDKRLWLALLRSSLTAWMAGELEDIGEGFASFNERTAAALALMSQELHKGSALAVSSGGVMGQFAQQTLGFPNSALIDVNFSLLNSSLCEYRMTRHGLKLISLNGLPHLSAPDDKALITVV